ncbi:MAG: hypothetical protein KA885_12870, partial [Spirochaetes bacterium]|nr:hypothetical protein [Spirochaetota bacterium]
LFHYYTILNGAMSWKIGEIPERLKLLRDTLEYILKKNISDDLLLLTNKYLDSVNREINDTRLKDEDILNER